MWGLSFSSSLASQGELRVPPCLSYPLSVFRPVLSFPPPCIALLIKKRLFFSSSENFAYVSVCVFLQETEHPQQVCSNETGDITAKEKSTYAGTHIQLHHFIKSPSARLLNHNFVSSPQSSVHSWPQGNTVFSLIFLIRRHLFGLFLYQVSCEDPRGKVGSFNE